MHHKVKLLMISARLDRGGGPKHVLDVITEIKGISDLRISVAGPEAEVYAESIKKVCQNLQFIDIPSRCVTIPAVLKLILQGMKCDVVHSHGRGAAVFALLIYPFVGAKFIHTYHGISLASSPGIRERIIDWFEERLSRFQSVVKIFVSASERETFRDKYGFVPEQAQVIVNGIRIFESRVFKRGDRPFRLITCTRFDEQKNTEDAIKIMASLKSRSISCRLSILGDGDGMDNCMALASQMGVADIIEFYGFVDNPAEQFRISHIYLSTSKWEGLPLAVLESMACGCIPVLSCCTGNKDILENIGHEFGYAVGDTEAAVDRIANIFSTNITETSEHIIEVVKNNYSIDAQVEELLSHYLSV